MKKRRKFSKAYNQKSVLSKKNNRLCLYPNMKQKNSLVMSDFTKFSKNIWLEFPYGKGKFPSLTVFTLREFQGLLWTLRKGGVA
jgi:hypothetical protein